MKKVFIILICFLLFLPRFSIAQTETKREHFLKELKKAKGTSRVLILDSICTTFSLEDNEDMLLYSNELLDLSKKINYKKGIAKGYQSLGQAFYYQSKFDSSLTYHKKALAEFELLKNKTAVANCLRKIGSIYIYTGDYPKTVEYILKSIPISKELKDTMQVAACYNNIAIAYFYSGNPEKAESYLINAAELYKLLKNEYELFDSYIGLGNVNDSRGDFEKAKYYYQNCVKIAENLDIEQMKIIAYGSLGLVYNSLVNYKLAIPYLKKGIHIGKKINNTENLTTSYTNLSYSYLHQREWKKALTMLDSALIYSNPESYLYEAEAIYENYSVIYEEIGSYKKALETRKKYTAIRDSIYKTENSEKINELTVQFDTKIKENKIIKLESLKQKNELEIIKKTAQRNVIIILSILILLIFIVLYFYWRQKRLNTYKKLVLNQEKITLLLKENEINYANAIIEGEEKERKRIAQDLHDRLGSMLATVKLQFSSGKEDDIKKAIVLLDKSVEEVRKISHNLASSSLVKFGLVSSLKSLSDSISSTNLKIDFFYQGLNQRLSSQIEIALYRCVQELISNIIKHAKASQVNIQLQKHDDDMNLIIEDNGIGFDSQKINSGIGLKNIESRIKALNGKVEYDSVINRGTTVIIEIPIV